MRRTLGTGGIGSTLRSVDGHVSKRAWEMHDMSNETEDDVELTELEEEFKRVIAEFRPRIEKKLREASDALDEAVRLSEESGVPFAGNPCPLNNNYIPVSFEGRFGDIDEELVRDLTNVWPHEYGGDGWEHSDIC